MASVGARLATLLTPCLALILLTRCGGDATDPPVDCVVEGLTVSPAQGSLHERVEDLSLTASVLGRNCAGHQVDWVVSPSDAGTFYLANGTTSPTTTGTYVTLRALRTGDPLTVTATADTTSATASFAVLPAPVAFIGILPAAVPVVLGTSRPVAVVLYDARGFLLTRPLTFSSSDPSRFSVTTDGVVTGATLGSARLLVTSEGVVDSAPVEVVNAGTIVYLTYGSGISDHYEVMDADGTHPRTDSFEPNLSPDSAHLAIATNPGHLVIETVSSGQLDTVPGITDITSIAWAPDGSKLLATRATVSGGEIFLVLLDGSVPVQVTTNNGQDPQWSPDGQQIAYTTGYTIDTQDIVVMNADGSNKQPLGRAGAYYVGAPRWSPNGQQLSFAYQFSPPPHALGEVWLMKPDGTNRHRLVAGSIPFVGVLWSPDGARILLIGYDTSSLGDLFSINADGSGLISLTSSDLVAEYPVRFTIP